MNDTSRTRIHWIDIPAIMLFIALAAIVLLQFVSRYILNDSVAWTEEIARYLLIGVAYAGSIVALRRGEHIFLEAVYRRVSTANIKPLTLMVDVINVSFHAVLTALTVGLALQADRRMISVDLPKSIVYGFVALTLLIATVISLQRLFFHIRQSSEEILRDMDHSLNEGSAT